MKEITAILHNLKLFLENYMIISKKLLIFYITERKYGKTIVYDELEEISEIVYN